MAIDYVQAGSLNLPSGLVTQQLRQKLNNLVINPSYVKIYLKCKDIKLRAKG